MSDRHGIVVRTWREPDGRWFASAEAVPEGIARAAVAGGELPDTASARAARAGRGWAVEAGGGDTEPAAVLEAVRRVLARGLDPKATTP